MLTVARFRRVFLVVLVASFGLSCVGCGGGNESSTIQVDEAREKSLTDSMRGYYDNENKKETKSENKKETKSENKS
jgi:hypothetical protein